MVNEKNTNNKEKSLMMIWRDFFQPSAGGELKNKKNRFLLIILLLGIILMFAGPYFSASEQTEEAFEQEEKTNAPAHKEFETDIARALEQILEHIDGISDVQVLISYASGKEGIYATTFDESTRSTLEKDREGGTREIEEITRREDQVLLRDGGGGEEALLLKEVMPEIKGVIVVARGVENRNLKLEVVRAIQSILDLPVHRIALLPYG